MSNKLILKKDNFVFMPGINYGGIWLAKLLRITMFFIISWATVAFISKNQSKNLYKKFSKDEDLLEILKRYAHGEINRNKFEQMKSDLTS